MVGINVADKHWLSAGFSFTYAIANAYAIFRFIGWRDGVIDVRLWLDSLASGQTDQPLVKPAPAELAYRQRTGLSPRPSFEEQPAEMAVEIATTLHDERPLAKSM
jgi:hypothetical protein